jgi:hypothetical protein
MLNRRLATEHGGSTERINNTEFRVVKRWVKQNFTPVDYIQYVQLEH